MNWIITPAHKNQINCITTNSYTHTEVIAICVNKQRETQIYEMYWCAQIYVCVFCCDTWVFLHITALRRELKHVTEKFISLRIKMKIKEQNRETKTKLWITSTRGLCSWNLSCSRFKETFHWHNCSNSRIFVNSFSTCYGIYFDLSF